MILRAIENIRQKPRSVRQRYAFVTAFIFTAVVTGIWSLSLPARFVAVQEGVMIASPEITNQAASVPFSGVWGEFKQKLIGLSNSKKSPITPETESSTEVGTSAAENKQATESDSVLLESGSMIRFGAQTEQFSSSTIMLGTTSTTSSTSPDQP